MPFSTTSAMRLVLGGAALIAGGVAAAEPGEPVAGVPAVAASAAAAPALVAGGVAGATEAAAEARMRTLFDAWKQADGPASRPAFGGISIPSVHPVEKLAFTSNFGIRSDPFTHSARMHAGVDIPGPVGTPIYATADGVVDRAERAGGYGNLVELDHGKGIQTRYGHLSKILVEPGTRVKRGDLIALMGSTGRSTGSHLHYEVRIDGKAVNPAPFLTTADYLTAVRTASASAIPVAMDGPAPQD